MYTRLCIGSVALKVHVESTLERITQFHVLQRRVALCTYTVYGGILAYSIEIVAILDSTAVSGRHFIPRRSMSHLEKLNNTKYTCRRVTLRYKAEIPFGSKLAAKVAKSIFLKKYKAKKCTFI